MSALRSCTKGAVVVGLLTGVAACSVASWARGAEKSAERAYFERVLRRIEPGLAGTPDRLPLYVRTFRRELITDTRLFACRIEAVPAQGGRLVLAGFVEFQENRESVQKLFEYLGFDELDNRIEVLPSETLGDMRFGLIRSTHSFSYDQPTGRREVLTDLLIGTPVYLLKEADDGYLLCHALEGYVGYVNGQDIERMDAKRFVRYQSAPQVRLLENQATQMGLTLPTAARLKLVKQKTNQFTVRLPGGSEVIVPAESCCVENGTPGARVERVIQVAERFLGTRYVWGGNTSEGIDCSGLVQTSFAAEGITLARDSNQQVLAGRLVATRWHRDGLRRGDTLYFLGEHGKIRHTGIYLGNDRYIEAVRPEVRYSSFDPASPEYSERGDASFCFGKRLLE